MQPHPEFFPIKKTGAFFSHCAIAPLSRPAFDAMQEFNRLHMTTGHLAWQDQYDAALSEFKVLGGRLLETPARNISFVRNTSEGINMIANGYPFEPGDEILSFAHEYPANHYPWRLQEKRGAKLVLIPNSDPSNTLEEGRVSGFSMEDVERLSTRRTKIIAVSHVHFATGFAIDLRKLGEFCKSHGIDLVVDAAQSFGALRVSPEECGAAAIIGSGWKWLLGPIGGGLMFTSEKLRAKLVPTMGGAELMHQGKDYLDHSWQPHQSGKMFEYSTSPISVVKGFNASLESIFLEYGIDRISAEILRLNDLFYDLIDKSKWHVVRYPEENRSGLLSLTRDVALDAIVQRALEGAKVMVTSRGGSGLGEFLRFAPHFYNDDAEVRLAAETLNSS